MEESTLYLAKKIAEQSIGEDAEHAAEALDGSPNRSEECKENFKISGEHAL